MGGATVKIEECEVMCAKNEYINDEQVSEGLNKEATKQQTVISSKTEYNFDFIEIEDSEEEDEEDTNKIEKHVQESKEKDGNLQSPSLPSTSVSGALPQTNLQHKVKIEVLEESMADKENGNEIPVPVKSLSEREANEIPRRSIVLALAAVSRNPVRSRKYPDRKDNSDKKQRNAKGGIENDQSMQTSGEQNETKTLESKEKSGVSETLTKKDNLISMPETSKKKSGKKKKTKKIQLDPPGEESSQKKWNEEKLEKKPETLGTVDMRDPDVVKSKTLEKRKKRKKEKKSRDQWRVVVACMLLNCSTSPLVKSTMENLFQLCPNAQVAAQTPTIEIEKVIQPLALQKKRSHKIRKMSIHYLTDNWAHISELPGVGRRAAETYDIFCNGKCDKVVPEDQELNYYLDFLKENSRLLSGGGCGRG